MNPVLSWANTLGQNFKRNLTSERETMIAMCEVISAKSRKLAREVLEMLDEPVLTINQRLERIEKELKKRKRLRSGRNKK